MNINKTGGPAFPIPGTLMQGTGMTLLDHFAGLAMQGQVAGMAATGALNTANMDWLAVTSYNQATAMLRARKQYLEGEQ